ncbi:MAG: sodium:solute symporter family protein [Planctomycetaceae bacterium]|nr:sodium:solute symporter family protein [Planctomycetaceae bacterium]
MLDTNFTNWDWLIVAVYLLGTAIFGMYVNRHVHSASHYLVGGRQAGTALSIASFIGTGLGLVTLMYASMDGFSRGFAYLFVPLVALVVTMGLGASGFVISHLRELNLTTIPEYFEIRYSRKVRILAGSICVLAGVLNMGLFPKMGATFIAYATGMVDSNDSAENVVNIITSLLIVMVLAYTVLGGMVAVLVTDYLQFVILSVGLGLGLWMCYSSPGLGWTNVVRIWSESHGEAAFNPVHPDSFGWAYVIWMVCLTFAAALCWAPEVTRALTTQDVRTTQKTFFLGSPGFFSRFAVPALWGITAFAFMHQDPELSQYFGLNGEAETPGHPSHAMPLLIGKIVPTGLLGILVAGLMAAFMSTHDSYLLAWASIASQDIIAPLKRVHRLTDAESIRYTRWIVVLIGLVLLIWGIWYELPESVWTYMGVTGTIYVSGSATALIGGMYWKRASSTGAVWGMCGGMLAIAGLFLESLRQISPKFLTGYISAESVALSVYVACVILFVAGSLIYPDSEEIPDEVLP